MNNTIVRVFCVLIILTLTTASTAGISIQDDWSGGPGVPGPNT